jgi:hypothetical protein
MHKREQKIIIIRVARTNEVRRFNERTHRISLGVVFVKELEDQRNLSLGVSEVRDEIDISVEQVQWVVVFQIHVGSGRFVKAFKGAKY